MAHGPAGPPPWFSAPLTSVITAIPRGNDYTAPLSCGVANFASLHHVAGRDRILFDFVYRSDVNNGYLAAIGLTLTTSPQQGQ